VNAKRILFDLLWLAGGGVFAWFFPRTALVIVALSAVVTLALRLVERRWT
jgi:hypothetical protein